jgi:hypothetical protein
MEPTQNGLLPVWRAVANRSVEVLDQRRLPREVRGPYEASDYIPATLDHILVSAIYWCGPRPVALLSTPAITLDLEILEEWFQVKVRPAQSTEVSAVAGSDLTAVPPAGLALMVPAFMDDSLLQVPYLWFPAADPALWLCLTPDDIMRVSGAFPVTIRAGSRRPQLVPVP